MRVNPTDAEARLWDRLRRKQIGGVRFRRQYPLGPYIVDFVCLPARLIVEVDGGQHDLQSEADGIRTRWLEAQGHRVIRFWNNDVLSNTDGVVERILVALRPRLDTPPPAPSRKGRGKKKGLPRGEGEEKGLPRGEAGMTVRETSTKVNNEHKN